MPNTCPPGVICLSNSLVIALFFICIIGIVIAMKHKTLQKTTEDETDELKDAEIDKTKQHYPPPIIVVNPQPPTASIPEPQIHVHNNMTSNTLAPPLRNMPNTTTVGVPINVHTRGATPDMQQVGILTDDSNDHILALYGRPTFRGSSKWMYFTATDKFQSIKLPIWKNTRNCTDDLGCDEVYDGDTIRVPAHGDKSFKATIYSLDAPRYIPFI